MRADKTDLLYNCKRKENTQDIEFRGNIIKRLESCRNLGV